MKKLIYLTTLFPFILLADLNVNGKVWNDLNKNWEQDVSEKNMAYIKVELKKETGEFVASTRTDKYGNYKFAVETEEVGEYLISVVPPKDMTVITSNNLDRWLGYDEVAKDINFGIYGGYKIRGNVWNDLDENWIRNKPEKAVSNVTVELYDGITNELIQTTTTNINGNYFFSAIDEGDHIIKIVPPKDYELLTSNNIDRWIEEDLKNIDFGIYKKDIPIAPESAYITTWEINNDEKFAIIKINKNYRDQYNYTVDWGDGEVDKNITNNMGHNYLQKGIYKVKITGSFPAIYENCLNKNTPQLEVNQWGTQEWKSLSHAFKYCKDLKISDKKAPNLSKTESMAYIFANSKNFNEDISHWNVSNIKNMSYLLAWTKNSNPNIKNWNPSSIKDMHLMFGYSDFDQDISKWNVSSAENISSLISNSREFNQDLSSWNLTSQNHKWNNQAMVEAKALSENNFQKMKNSWKEYGLELIRTYE